MCGGSDTAANARQSLTRKPILRGAPNDQDNEQVPKADDPRRGRQSAIKTTGQTATPWGSRTCRYGSAHGRDERQGTQTRGTHTRALVDQREKPAERRGAPPSTSRSRHGRRPARHADRARPDRFRPAKAHKSLENSDLRVATRNSAPAGRDCRDHRQHQIRGGKSAESPRPIHRCRAARVASSPLKGSTGPATARCARGRRVPDGRRRRTQMGRRRSPGPESKHDDESRAMARATTSD